MPKPAAPKAMSSDEKDELIYRYMKIWDRPVSAWEIHENLETLQISGFSPSNLRGALKRLHRKDECIERAYVLDDSGELVPDVSETLNEDKWPPQRWQVR